MKNKVKLFCLYTIPFILPLIIAFHEGIYYAKDRNDLSYTVMEASVPVWISALYFIAFFGILLTTLTCWIKNGKRTFAAIVSFLLGLFSYFYVMHFLITGASVNSNTLFAIFDTNILEFFDFVRNISLAGFVKAGLFTIAYWGPYIYLIRSLNSEGLNIQAKKLSIFLFFGCLLCASLLEFAAIHSHFEFMTAPIKSYAEYRTEIKKINEMNNRLAKTPVDGISSLMPQEEPQTFVIVIGESASRRFFTSYRTPKTAPSFLDERNDFIVYNTIYASYPVTAYSLADIFFPRDLQQENKFVGLIPFFKNAGFKTFWLSNQFRLGENDNIVGLIARTADEYIFINNADTYRKDFNTVPLDENLLPYYEHALNDPAPKKVIFVHLFGSHFPFNRRYPQHMTFSINEEAFLPLPHAKSNQDKKNVLDYEKSLIYTNKVLESLFIPLEQKNEASYFLYFSDHGTDPVQSFHRKDKSASVLEVPFILWVSPKYKQLNQTFVTGLESGIDKQYKMDRLFHSVADLSRLSHPLIKKQASLFSPELEETTDEEIKNSPELSF